MENGPGLLTGRFWGTLTAMAIPLIRQILLLAAFAVLTTACSGQDRHVTLEFLPGEQGQTAEHPLEISSAPDATASVSFRLTSIGSFVGDASVLVFPDPLCLNDLDDEESCLDLLWTPERPYTFARPGQERVVTLTLSTEDGLVTEDGVFRIRISAGPVGQLVETGVDLYFRIIP